MEIWAVGGCVFSMSELPLHIKVGAHEETTRAASSAVPLRHRGTGGKSSAIADPVRGAGLHFLTFRPGNHLFDPKIGKISPS